MSALTHYGCTAAKIERTLTFFLCTLGLILPMKVPGTTIFAFSIKVVIRTFFFRGITYYSMTIVGRSGLVVVTNLKCEY